ncbi:hypothetical protein N7493_011573 [Penicillium malachiteum]|uniref:Uncharacterized protein n=1 Tax=Penicillium malachiteum TaxID=1324776 RepID=A0AAD6HB48_9EURO|nr:hypothetical protein N7493_011573 [Penicillium malachiteum]
MAMEVPIGPAQRSRRITLFLTNKVPPVLFLLEFPLAIYRVPTRDNGTHGCLDNRAITCLNMAPATGIAPPNWQSGIGTVILARKDKKDITPEHYEGIWMYCDYIRDYFGDGVSPTQLYRRTSFERWFEGYKREAIQMGRSEFINMPSLYP